MPINKDSIVYRIMANKPNLELDLYKCESIMAKVQENEAYAVLLYGALCNTSWYKDGFPEDEWYCSWRSAAAIVATMRNNNECYMDFYCAGGEGEIDDQIMADLSNIGWCGSSN